jgi:AhpD family alkylhydroperoxidase
MGSRFSECTFTATEKETIEIVTSIENGCKYRVAGHSAFAAMQQVDEDIVNALRQNKPIDDLRIEALATFVRKMIRSKGRVTQKDLILFFDAGFTKAQFIEVVLGISLKFFTNFISNAVSLPLDPIF